MSTTGATNLYSTRRNRRTGRQMSHHKTFPDMIWSSVFSVWLVWVTALILISLVLDAKFLLSLVAGS